MEPKFPGQSKIRWILLSRSGITKIQPLESEFGDSRREITAHQMEMDHLKGTLDEVTYE